MASNPNFFKSGVSINGISSEMLFALWQTAHIYNNYGQNLTVTSARDGKHKVNSLHYSGQALDFRTYDVEKSKMQLIYSALHFSLSNRGYDVILESDHLHIEFDPSKKPTNQNH